MTNCSCICYPKICAIQDTVRVVNRVKLVKYNSTWWNDWMSCLLLLFNWNDTDLEVFHNFSHRELKMHSSVFLEPLLLFNGICRTSMGWNCLGNLRIWLFTMQGLMIMFFILQSFAFYVFPTFLDNKKKINIDGPWYFDSRFSTCSLFFLQFQWYFAECLFQESYQIGKICK